MTENRYTVIDKSTWRRKGQFDNFAAYDCPVFSLSSRIDVTGLTDYCRQRGLSLFSSMLYIVACEINKREQFRYRIADGRPVLYERSDPSYVVMYDGDRIVGRSTEFSADFADFYARNRADIEAVKKLKGYAAFQGSGDCSCFYVSCIPWLDMCAMSNPYNFKDVSQTSIPRITWGKICNEGGRSKVYFDVQMHHALADGYHVAQLINGVAGAAADAAQYLGGNHEG